MSGQNEDLRLAADPCGFEVLSMEDACLRAGETRERGFSLLEVALSTVILGAVLIGTLGSLSTAAIGQRHDGARVESQLLLSRVMEELRVTAFNSLVSYDGTWIEEGRHRADINVSPRGPGLLKLSVRVRQLENEEIETRGVLLVMRP
ncbi:MAG: hypothetical protein VX272_07260 [Planctomycetota bacterium]|nr:hypothetical protein [Planctomycetota bacterium]MEE3230822.1 hypothetical protein [Planctomycetota bacterium]